MVCVEKAIDYDLVPIDRGSDAHGALHPFRRMPVLEVDGEFMTETLAIASYLAEAFPGRTLTPDGFVALARMRTWMSICADYLFRDVVRTVPRGRQIADDERTTARTALERVESMIDAQPFLVGDTLTLADLYLAPQFANCREKAPDLLEGLDRLASWAGAIVEHDSFKLTAYVA